MVPSQAEAAAGVARPEEAAPAAARTGPTPEQVSPPGGGGAQLQALLHASCRRTAWLRAVRQCHGCWRVGTALWSPAAASTHYLLPPEPTHRPLQHPPSQITAIKAAIAAASTLEEVRRLEDALRTGHLPSEITVGGEEGGQAANGAAAMDEG